MSVRLYAVFLATILLGGDWSTWRVPVGPVSISASPENVMLYVLLLVVLAEHRVRQIPVIARYEAPFLAFFAAGVTLVAVDFAIGSSPVSATEAFRGIAALAASWLTFKLIRTRSDLIYALRWFVIVTILSSLLTLGGVIPSPLQRFLPLPGIEQSTLQFGAFQLPFARQQSYMSGDAFWVLLMGALSLILTNIRAGGGLLGKEIWFGRIAALVLLMAVFVVQSRAAYVAVGSVLVIFAAGFVANRFRAEQRLFVKAMMVGAAVAFVVILTTAGLTSGFLGSSLERNLTERIGWVPRVIELVADGSLLGVSNVDVGAHPHNAFLQALLNNGVLGLGILVGYVAIPLLRPGARSNLDSALFRAIIGGLILNLFFIGIFQKPFALLLTWMLIAKRAQIREAALLSPSGSVSEQAGNTGVWRPRRGQGPP